MLGRLKSIVIPKDEYSKYSIYDQTKISVFFSIATSIFIIGLITVAISLGIKTYPALVPAIGNIVFAIIALILLKYKGYRFSSIVYFSILFFLLFGNLIFNFGTMHIASPFWIMLLNIIVIYILGKKWGIGFMLMSSVAFGYYVVVILPTTIQIMESLSEATYYSVLYETIFVMILLGYVIFTIINASKMSDRLLKNKNISLKEKNATILQNNNEQALLLREIHHRVKNNLQIIISLMRLKMHDLNNEETSVHFKEMINRVMTMSRIHEKIYLSESLSRINLEHYFYDLSKDLIDSYNVDYSVDLEYKFELDSIELKTIIPLALIFNELFSNSLKHAFKNTCSPMISLKLVSNKEDQFNLIYKDNGTWIPQSRESSFGIELINSLTEQLNGTYFFRIENKVTKYSFTFVL